MGTGVETIKITVYEDDFVIVIDKDGNFRRWEPHHGQTNGDASAGGGNDPALEKKPRKWQQHGPPTPPGGGEGGEGQNCQWVWHSGRWYWCCLP